MSDFKRLLHLYLFLFRNAVNRNKYKESNNYFSKLQKRCSPFIQTEIYLITAAWLKRKLSWESAGLLSGKSRVQIPAGPTLIRTKNRRSRFTALSLHDLFLWDVREPTLLFEKSRGRRPRCCGQPLPGWVVICKDTLKLEPRSVGCSAPYGGSD